MIRSHKIWVGIEMKERRLGPHHYPGRKMIGVVIRAARLRALGHFMYGQVSINGEKMWAGGAEARIFPFHHVTLEWWERAPKDMISALGFCVDKNGYAFMYNGEPHIITGSAILGMDQALTPVPQENQPKEWVLA